MNRYRAVGAIFALFFFFSNYSSAHALEAHTNIKGLFNTTRDVVVKCLECHKEKASEVLQSTHWTWKSPRMVNGRQQMFGKMDSLAGFAIDVASNPDRCLQCHISSAPDTVLFEKSGEAEVDCLVCHDTTGRYSHRDRQNLFGQSDFEEIAHNVGKPAPANCAGCHFADCGLPQQQNKSASAGGKGKVTDSDIHMNGTAASFSCQSCHKNNSGHSFSRSMPQGGQFNNSKGCASCHTQSAHRLASLNRHSNTIACRTCHIPLYAGKKASITGWNWFLTGKASARDSLLADSNYPLLDGNGFSFAKMIRPVYLWDDGSDLIYSRGQRINPEELTYLQRPSQKNQNSKIAPFKVIYGTQLYDAKYRYLISPLLSVGTGNIFPDTGWDTIAHDGMKAIVLPYSGEYNVAVTAAYRRLNHGVTPAAESLDCTDCHGGKGRLNWQALGYIQDPWAGDDNGQTDEEIPENSTLTQELSNPEPEMQLEIQPFPGS